MSQMIDAPVSQREIGPTPETMQGFHGDDYLLRLVAHLMSLGVKAFVETGTNMGTTSRYVARTYPHLRVYTCEADKAAAAQAAQNLAAFEQVQSVHGMSPQFLYDLHDQHPELKGQLNLYWLDAHGYGFTWPLRDEVDYLTHTLPAALVMIDDFQVPLRPEFKHDRYRDQVCCYRYIAPGIDPSKDYYLLYPSYTRHTSKHHPLTGTGLLVWGVKGFALPAALAPCFAAFEIPARV